MLCQRGQYVAVRDNACVCLVIGVQVGKPVQCSQGPKKFFSPKPFLRIVKLRRAAHVLASCRETSPIASFGSIAGLLASQEFPKELQRLVPAVVRSRPTCNVVTCGSTLRIARSSASKLRLGLRSRVRGSVLCPSVGHGKVLLSLQSSTQPSCPA